MSTSVPLLPGIRLLRIAWRMLPPVVVAGLLVLLPRFLEADASWHRQAWVAAAVIVGFSLVSALIQEVLSPYRPGMRLWPMKDHRAERLAAVARTLLWILLGTELLIYLARANGWNPAVAGGLALLRNVGLVVFTGSALSRTGLFRRLLPERVDSVSTQLRWLTVRVFYPLALLTAIFVAVAHALGYVALAHWVLRGSLWTALIVAVACFLHRALRGRLQRMVAFLQAEEALTTKDAAVAAAAPVEVLPDEGAPVLASAVDAAEEEPEPAPPPEPSPAWIGIERIAAGALRLVVVVGTLLALMAAWELKGATLRRALDTPVLGGWSLTWGNLVGGVLAFVAVMIVTALIRNLLIFILFPRAKVDTGARYAVLAILRYASVAVAIVLALGAFGVDTGAFAVFAGAFGVGLAFGLQDIFANFFSGLIMLLERPVRVGDTIDVGGSSGKVEAIRLRGTTIRTFENTTIIIPNRQMIGERLSNLSHDMPFARIQLDVGVSYDADLRQVERVLLDVIERDGRLLEDPAPHVRLQAFGASSVDFVARCYTDQTGDRWQIASDLRRTIFERFKAEGIEIPFPQQDVHLDWPGPAPSD